MERVQIIVKEERFAVVSQILKEVVDIPDHQRTKEIIHKKFKDETQELNSGACEETKTGRDETQVLTNCSSQQRIVGTVAIFPIPQVGAESNEAETSGSDLDKTDEVRSARPRVAWTLFCAWRISSKRQSRVGHVRPQDGGGQVGKFKGWTWPSSVREVTVQQGRVQLVTSEGKCSCEVASVLRSGSLDLSEVVAKSPLFLLLCDMDRLRGFPDSMSSLIISHVNESTLGCLLGSIKSGQRPTYLLPRDPSGFIVKPAPNPPDSNLKQEPSVKTLWQDDGIPYEVDKSLQQYEHHSTGASIQVTRRQRNWETFCTSLGSSGSKTARILPWRGC